MTAHKNNFKNMGQSLFKKYSKFQKFDHILYCGITIFRNFKLGVFRKFQKFQLSNFTLTWSNNSILPDTSY